MKFVQDLPKKIARAPAAAKVVHVAAYPATIVEVVASVAPTTISTTTGFFGVMAASCARPF